MPKHANASSQGRRQVLVLTALIGATLAVFVGADQAYAGPVDLLVSSSNSNEVLRYDGTTGAFLGVFASAGNLDAPNGLAVGPDGNVYVSGGKSDNVLCYDGQSGALIGEFVSPQSGGLDFPHGLTFGPDDHLYVAGAGSDAVLRYNGVTGASMGVFASSPELSRPADLVFGPDGHLYVGSRDNASILRYDGLKGDFMDTFVPSGSGGLNSVLGLVFGPDDNLYVTSSDNNRVLRYDGRSGDFMDEFVSEQSGQLNFPVGLVFGPDDHLYVASTVNSNVQHYNGQTGMFINVFTDGGGLAAPTYLIFIQKNFEPGPWELVGDDIVNTNTGNVGVETTLSVAGDASFSSSVGIGTMTPATELDVIGDVSVSGTVDGVDISEHAADPNAHHTPPTELPPIGLAGGDLSGDYPDPTVAALQGRSVSALPPNPGESLVWDGTAWSPGAAGSSPWQTNGTNISYTDGNVGVGITTPVFKLDAAGPFAIRGDGLIGVAGFSNTSIGILGVGPPTGSAGLFLGNLVSTGTKMFKIDHPLDPANKYLMHSCVESSEMKNVYDGNTVLDADGKAWVHLPEWFEALNHNFRYQLTAIGAPGPKLHVAHKITNNAFQIAGGRPGMEVSWQITGVRQDPWARGHTFKVEQEKMADERGLYFHPELYGQPKELRLHDSGKALEVEASVEANLRQRSKSR